MTTPDQDSETPVGVEQAIADLRVAILRFFESNPLDEAHRQVDKDELHRQVLAQIERQPDVSARAAEAHAAAQGAVQTQPKSAPPHATPSVHAQASPAPTEAGAAGPGGEELSGAAWFDRFPEHHGGLGDLKDAFRTGVEAFIAAMEAAGIKVHVVDTLRSHPRAYLMHWSYVIREGGLAHAAANVAKADADRLAGVDIRWTHTGQGGAFDAAASVKAATELAARFGLDAALTVAPARDSRHVTGHAVDMTTVWAKEAIKILDGDGAEVDISTAPRSGMNPELWQVGKTYGVWHYGTWSSDMSKPGHDRNHWSTDGH
jgi:hypothetical protein